MADDCKYGSSLSVCLSVRCVSVLASPVPVSCGCPRPARALLRPPRAPRRSPSSRCPLGTGPSWVFSVGGDRTWTLLGCLDLGVQGSVLGRGRCWAAGAVPRVRGSRGRAEPNFLLRAGGAGGHWSRSRGSGVCRADGGSSSPLVPRFPRGRAVAVVRAAGSIVLGHAVPARRLAAGARLFPGQGTGARTRGSLSWCWFSEQAASVLPRLLGLGLSRAREGPNPPRPEPASSTGGAAAAWVRPGADLQGQTLVPVPPPPLISNSSIWTKLGPAPSSPPTPHPWGGVCVVPALWGTRSPCPPSPRVSFSLQGREPSW